MIRVGAAGGPDLLQRPRGPHPLADQARVGVEPVGDLAHQLVAPHRLLAQRLQHRRHFGQRPLAAANVPKVCPVERGANPEARQVDRCVHQVAEALNLPSSSMSAGSASSGIAATRRSAPVTRHSLRADHRVGARSVGVQRQHHRVRGAPSACSCSGVIAVPMIATVCVTPAWCSAITSV